MSRQRIYLLFIALFTLAFMLLVLLGGYLLTFAVASFLFAFGALFGQIGSLALYLRHKSLHAASSPQRNRHG